MFFNALFMFLIIFLRIVCVFSYRTQNLEEQFQLSLHRSTSSWILFNTHTMPVVVILLFKIKNLGWERHTLDPVGPSGPGLPVGPGGPYKNNKSSIVNNNFNVQSVLSRKKRDSHPFPLFSWWSWTSYSPRCSLNVWFFLKRVKWFM